mgnify:CR=1 FL=1
MNQVINQEVDRQVNQLIDKQMNQVIWQDELVMWIKDFTVAFSEGAYSVPFEHSMARRAIIEQGATFHSNRAETAAHKQRTIIMRFCCNRKQMATYILISM